MFESVLFSELWVSDRVFVIVVGRAIPINTFLICARPISRLLPLVSYNKGVDQGIVGHIPLVFFVDFGVSTNSEDCIE